MDNTQLLEEHYGLHNIKLQHLEGFEDKTFKVVSLEGKFVFKRYKFLEEAAAIIEAETRLLQLLSADANYNFPKTITCSNGQPYILADGTICRLLSFLEGELLGDTTQSNDILRSFGSLLGSMDHILSNIYEPALSGRESPWDLRHFKLNLPFLPYILNSSDRNLVDYFFLQFDECIGPVANKLRKSVIHNDANDWNVVTANNSVTGLFDFGDLCHTWLVNEVAIGITYIMMNKERPLEAATEVIKGYHQEFPLMELEIDALYYLVAARLCTSVCNSAFGKSVKPDSDYVTISEEAAWDLLHKWIQISPKRAQQTFRKALGFSDPPPSNTLSLLKKREKLLSKSLSLSYDVPINMDRAAFQYMYDDLGNTYLDAYNNIMLVGHCHPYVVRKGQSAMASLNTNTRYLYDIMYRYAEKILNKFPKSLGKIFFVNSGSEASDLAIRMARAHTAKKQVLVLENGYHGNTSAGMDISHYKYASGNGTGKSPFIVEAPMPKAFGSGYENDGSAGLYFAKLTRERIKDFENDIAAFIAEPVMGCGGQVPLAKLYLQEVYSAIRKQGGVCISDEVQVGFGRLGDSFWGYELHEVVPDIVVLGKPMGNGHPIGAVVTTAEIAESFENGPEFFSSFGGNPVSCSIGLAVLEVIEEEELQSHAKNVGDHLKGLLQALQIKYPVMADIRGYGLFLGVEFADSEGTPLTEMAQKLKNELRERYILVGTDGPDENVLKIKPPLSFSKTNAGTLAEELDLIMQSFL
ncbi:MAG: aminotransferase class III-fold pyridoxal phosphate-dependent enzyme [Flavobacteriaceae bacterium]